VRAAQARRLDGKMWKRKDSKAWTLPGSVGAWPISLREAQRFPAIALVEGGPDLLAVFHLAWLTAREETIAAVAILGASLSIPEAALPLFTGKEIKIFPHLKGDGQKAGMRWAAQLQSAGANPGGYSFEGLVLPNGSPVDDVNDLATVVPEESAGRPIEDEIDLLRDVFVFGPQPLTP
jgi:hypothetical protein